MKTTHVVAPALMLLVVACTLQMPPPGVDPIIDGGAVASNDAGPAPTSAADAIALGDGDAVAGAGSVSPDAALPPPPSPPPPPLANLPAWVNALGVGQWTQIPNTHMSSVEPSPVPAGNTGPNSKVIAWTSFVIDPRDSTVYSPANGGHT